VRLLLRRADGGTCCTGVRPEVVHGPAQRLEGTPEAKHPCIYECCASLAGARNFSYLDLMMIALIAGCR
jgi:hypothetical protein